MCCAKNRRCESSRVTSPQGPVILRKPDLGEGSPSPPSQVNLSERLYEKNVDHFARVNSAHACSECLNSAQACSGLNRVNPDGRVKGFLWTKVGSTRGWPYDHKRVTRPFKASQQLCVSHEGNAWQAGSPSENRVGEYPARQDNFSQYKSALKLLCSA